MEKIIQQIREIMGQNDSSVLKITIYNGNEITFDIYEIKVPIFVNIKNKSVYLDCECYEYKLTGDMLIELGKIIKVLEDNFDAIVECVKLGGTK